MNLVQFEECAFIFPDDMDAFRKRYGADIIYIDAVEQVVQVLGPNDKQWRELPEDSDSPKLVSIRRDNGQA